MRNRYLVLVSSVLALMPTFVFAADKSFKSLVGMFIGILETVFQIIFWIIFFYVAWTLVQRWMKPGGEDYAEGKRTVIAGVFGLVIISSLWGLVAYVQFLFR